MEIRRFAGVKLCNTAFTNLFGLKTPKPCNQANYWALGFLNHPNGIYLVPSYDANNTAEKKVFIKNSEQEYLSAKEKIDWYELKVKNPKCLIFQNFGIIKIQCNWSGQLN